ncbi:MAG TPA: mannose-6-phosphate isomerase, class I [Streptosporangiaceae bacterium]
MDVLEPVIQHYAWGSRQAIAELQGRAAPADQPEAELWMGAHPSSPSGLERGARHTTLDQVIAADPARELGARCADQFDGRLPFLLKVLAPDKALSIQVHPDRVQAQAGYQAEEQQGIPRGDRSRNYVDDWPKPELLCAITRFEVLAGFRGVTDTLILLDELAAPALAPVADMLRAENASTGRAGALAWALSRPPGERETLQDEVLAACRRVAAGPGPHAAACVAVLQIAADHPGDPGVVAALLLNYQVLEPDEALFMAAGGLHAYLKGVGVELLANSDNVLRAGLTGKHIDVPELLRIADPAVAVPIVRPRPVADGVFAYDAPVQEFRLYRMNLTGSPGTVPDQGPRIALCITGTATLRTRGGDAVKLTRGGSCFLSAADGTVTASGDGTLFVAASGCG